MNKRTLVTLIVAVLLGSIAFVATFDLTHGAAHRHTPVSQDDDPGLIP